MIREDLNLTTDVHNNSAPYNDWSDGNMLTDEDDTHLGVVDGELVDAPGVLPLGAQGDLEVCRDEDRGSVSVSGSGELDLAPHAVLGHAGDQVETCDGLW